jgi:hypothetical protein
VAGPGEGERIPAVTAGPVRRPLIAFSAKGGRIPIWPDGRFLTWRAASGGAT